MPYRINIQLYRIIIQLYVKMIIVLHDYNSTLQYPNIV